MDVNQGKKPPLLIITGERGVGKSNFCQLKVDHARKGGWNVAGLLSVPLIENEKKVGIDIENISNGERRLLAAVSPGSCRGPRLGAWFFDAQVIAWANQVLEQAPSCDLLIIDELGALEFFQDQGFMAAFPLLDRGEYQLAMVVIRPECLKQALERWPWAKEIWIPKSK